MSLSNNFPTIRPSLLLDFANTKSLDSRITFTRASTATYYDGKTTAMAEQNLLTYSQDFDNAAWTKVAATVTANSAAAPDGTTTADSVIEDSSTGAHQVTMVSSAQASVPYTVSCYLKAGARSFAALQVNATAAASWVSIDLSTGTVGTITALSGGGLPSASASSVSVGNGWYRIILTFTPAAGNTQVQAYFGPALDATTRSYAGNGTGSVLVWGAQVEQRSSVTAYTATTSAPITNYIPVLLTAASGVARFDNNPTTGESLGLLIEEQRTNLLTYSDQFDNAAWLLSGAAVATNTVVAPDGTLTGDRLSETTAASTHRIIQTVASAPSAVVASVYVKASGKQYFQVYTANNTTNFVTFDIINGTVTNTGASVVSSQIQSVGNGWFRCSVAFSANSTNFYFGLANTSSAAYAPSYTGDGFSGVFLWGAQVEAGAFATSYIATTSAQVTRAADAASMTGTNFSSWYNAAEGSLFAESIPVAQANYGIASINDNTVSNRMSLQTSATNAMAFRYVSSSGNFTSTGVTYTAGTSVKASYVYRASDQAVAVNTTLGTGITNQSLTPLVNQLQIGVAPSVGYINGTIKKIAYYPVRLQNSQLQALTS